MTTPPDDSRPVILVVEDDPAAVRLIEEAFSQVDRPVTLLDAADGVEAFDILYNRGVHAETPQPDLILLDLNLPARSGQQILTEIQATDDVHTIPVIVLSQNDAPETITECYRLGANAYVVKPMDYDGMRTVVTDLTDFWFETAVTPSR